MAAAGLAWVAGCSHDSSAPCSSCPPPPPLTGLLVSSPVPSTAAALSALALSPAADLGGNEVAYVSLTPGTVPTGSRAVVRRVGDANLLTTALSDGGFDPIPVPSQTGDSIDVVIDDPGGAVVYHTGAVVLAARPPVIVRTDPPPRRRDVPLNANLVIVFSEPIDATTLTPTSVRLLQGGNTVAGSARLLDASLDAVQEKAAFVPDAPLAAGTDYQLVVSPAVRDRDGKALAAADTVPFTTGVSLTGPPASISISVDTGVAGAVPPHSTLVVGTTLQLTATVRDAAGNELTDQSVTWLAEDSNYVRVSPTGLVTALSDVYAAGVGVSVGPLGTGTWFSITPLPAASITVAPTSTSVGAGDTIMLAATVRDAAGRIINQSPLYWTSSAPATASVPIGVGQRTAMVTGVSSGAATITASTVLVDSGQPRVSGNARVTVGPRVPVASVTVSPPAVSLVVQGVFGLTATLRDVSGKVLATRPTTWTSSNAAVATVDTGVIGWVRAVAPGSTTITATSEGVSGTATVTVTTIQFASLGAGLFNSCGVTTKGAAYCWGDNELGQVGVGLTTGSFSIPEPVTGGLAFAAVSPGGFFTCGLAAGGSGYCWGNNDYGQLGNGSGSIADTATGTPTPVAVLGGLNFTAVSSGGYHACGLTAGGAAYCWGRDYDGELGDGSFIPRSVPVAVAGGLSFTAVSSGVQHTCGITTDGAAYCWGASWSGQLGNGTDSSTTGGSWTGSSVPVAVAGGLHFSVLSTGAYYACGLTGSGAVYCWGNNERGQLGDGSTTSRSVPVQVAGGLTFTAVSAGGWYACGLTAGGVAYCWGDNRAGQLGSGSTGELSLVPVAVAGGHSFATLIPGIYHVCGLTTSGVAYCWGDNYFGQLGDGSTTNRYVPVKVAGQP